MESLLTNVNLARVVPILKFGDSYKNYHYRPISSLPIISLGDKIAKSLYSGDIVIGLFGFEKKSLILRITKIIKWFDNYITTYHIFYVQ